MEQPETGAASVATEVKNHGGKRASLHTLRTASQDHRSRTTIGKQSTRRDRKPQTGIR
jgi:hypothetical protein